MCAYAGRMDVSSHPNLAEHRHVIELQARHEGLPVELVSAMVLEESSGDTEAWNPEPHYRWVWDVRRERPFRVTSAEALDKAPPENFPCYCGDRDAEWWGQQASWGLLQLMGAVAREMGFDRTQHFPALCRNPELNLAFGCAYLRRLHARWHREHGWPGVVAAYNAGSPRLNDGGRFVNQRYVDKVAVWVDLRALP